MQYTLRPQGSHNGQYNSELEVFTASFNRNGIRLNMRVKSNQHCSTRRTRNIQNSFSKPVISKQTFPGEKNRFLVGTLFIGSSYVIN